MKTNTPAIERILAEYREMPGLSLTAPQAARLFGLGVEPCGTMLQALVAQGQLRHTKGGRYSAAGDLERVRRPRLFRTSRPAA
jgi:hypothetical protein